MPSKRELDHYNSSYFENAHGGLEKSEEAMRFSSGIAALRLRHIEAYSTRKQVHVESVLEIGPGHGFFRKHLLGRFPGTDYVAVETDSSCRCDLKTLGVRTFDNLASMSPDCNSHFDLAVAAHVLEHTSAPVPFVQSITRQLKPGGVIFIEVPCRDYEFKEKNEPHLLFFDEPSMRKLLTKVGLEEIEITYHGKEIARLRSERSLSARYKARLVRIWERLAKQKDQRSGWGQLDEIENSAERDTVITYEAHLVKTEPSWWLRALARRSCR